MAKEGVVEVGNYFRGPDWINTLSEILGQPKYKLTPQGDMLTHCEGAIFYLRRKGESESTPLTDKNAIAINVIRHTDTLQQPDDDFTVDIRTQYDARQVKHYFRHIRRFVVNQDLKSISFFESNDQSAEAAAVLYNSGVVIPELS